VQPLEDGIADNGVAAAVGVAAVNLQKQSLGIEQVLLEPFLAGHNLSKNKKCC
jgi:hypothetical protein